MPKRRPLTAKQRRFATLVAGGQELATAYRMVYNASQMQQPRVRVEASRLAAQSRHSRQSTLGGTPNERLDEELDARPDGSPDPRGKPQRSQRGHDGSFKRERHPMHTSSEERSRGRCSPHPRQAAGRKKADSSLAKPPRAVLNLCASEIVGTESGPIAGRCQSPPHGVDRAGNIPPSFERHRTLLD